MQFTVRVTVCMTCETLLSKSVYGGPFGEYRMASPTCAIAPDGGHAPTTFALEMDTAMLPARPDGTAAIEGDVAPVGPGRLGTRRLTQQFVEYWASFRWDGLAHDRLEAIGGRVCRDVELLANIARQQENLLDAYREARASLGEVAS